MMMYFALFSALVICAGLLVAKAFERRQDVLYGPYIDPRNNRNQFD